MRRRYPLNPLVVGLHNNSQYEPQRDNHFETSIFLPLIMAGGDAIRIEEMRRALTLAIQDTTMPNHTNNVVDVQHSNALVHYAGINQYGGFDSFNVIDFIGSDMEGVLYSWRSLVANPETGQVGWAAIYKTQAQIIEYSGDGACLSSWLVEGVFPSGLNVGAMSKGQGNIKTMSVQMSHDMSMRKWDSTNRYLHAEFSVLAGQNMLWKHQDLYAMENAGGSIQPYKSFI